VDPRRILVVDDEFSSTEVLALILREEGFGVTVASNGRQALERLDDAAPDLVISDYMMPVMNGAEMARALRGHPGHARVPILMLSSVPESALKVHRDCYDRYLRKPFDLDALLEAVRSLLGALPPHPDRAASR
jgi:CheY-like chemotaxis protein